MTISINLKSLRLLALSGPLNFVVFLNIPKLSPVDRERIMAGHFQLMALAYSIIENRTFRSLSYLRLKHFAVK